MFSTFRWKGVSDVIALGAASVQSAVFGSQTREIRVSASGNCWINIGANPTAAATDNNGIYLPANVVDYLHVNPGERLAVIQDGAATGNLCVAEMTR